MNQLNILISILQGSGVFEKDRISEEVEALAREVLTPKEYGLKKLGTKKYKL